MKTGRRGFLSKMFLTFSIFEAICLADSRLKSPIDLMPEQLRLYGIFSEQILLATCLDEQLAIKITNLWSWDALSSEDCDYLLLEVSEKAGLSRKQLNDLLRPIKDFVMRGDGEIFFTYDDDEERPEYTKICRVLDGLKFHPITIKPIESKDIDYTVAQIFNENDLTLNEAYMIINGEITNY